MRQDRPVRPGLRRSARDLLAVVDDRLRRSDRHAPTVGILLCKGRNDTLVRYALAGAPAPLAVADYTYDSLPPQERGGLPTAAELAAALEPPATPAAPGRYSRSVPVDRDPTRPWDHPPKREAAHRRKAQPGPE